jgi:hypothetical protein
MEGLERAGVVRAAFLCLSRDQQHAVLLLDLEADLRDELFRPLKLV